ncbi:MAG: lysylphosphatidylglycerol synthase transmembrane domain-containing protein [Candidatus Omnitrophica bacterium]|nr:lysylphosphatidylglycerol synthase transmembrane domain-containing protein [Candidatus Omnitrophota bacterium]MDD5236345.1 lysylphosphatidylglycerol synthase transmembrane domain-containing protein [Candidatus Omnitrophota bacterium]
MKKILTIALRISISIALLIFLFYELGTPKLFATLKNADVILAFVAFLLLFGTYVLAFYRWEMLIEGADVHISRKRIVSSFCGGIFSNLFLPSSIGGDFMRSVDLTRHTAKPKEIIATVFLDRLSGYVALVILVLLALLAGHNLKLDKSIYLTVIILVVLLVAIILVVFNSYLYGKTKALLNLPFESKIKEMILGLHHEIYIFRHKRKILLKNILCSLMLQGGQFVVSYIIARALGINIKPVYFFIFIPIVSAVTMLPISIGGLGLRDAATVVLFAKVGLSKDLAFAMSLVNDFFVFAIGIIGGLIYVSTLHYRRVQHH